MKRLRVAVLDPGHFHAALSLRESHPGLEDDIQVYAPEGPGLAAFRGYIESFNRRADRPTRWQVRHRNEADPLGALVRDRSADLVILAGRNHSKLEAIERLNGAGFMIFADKPWVTSERALPALVRAMGRDRPPTTDIMTSRFEPTSILLRALLAAPDVFGQPRCDGPEPALALGSVHHLFKEVNGSVLRRPPWYFDVGIQGEGIVDVTTHLVDLVHWTLFPGQEISLSGDLHLEGASRWTTPVPLERYRRITGDDAFPDSVRAAVEGQTLQLQCNGEIAYRVKGIPVRVNVEWRLEAAAGAGDTHSTIARGTRADLVIRQLPERGYRKEFAIVPRGPGLVRADAIEAVLRGVSELPGVGVRAEGGEFLLEIPAALQTTHEQHFCAARDAFLETVARGTEPPEHRVNVVTKYALLAAARALAHGAAPGTEIGGSAEGARRNS